ncbi:MAG: hypothetical protein AB1403_06275 [Candidatus Riflebacteria bacterium]
MKTSFPVSARKAIMLLALMLVITVFTACDKNINGMFNGSSSGNIAPSMKEGIILTKEEADKMLATNLDIDGDGSIATNSYWFTSQMFPAANKSIKASVRASSSPNGKTILFFTRLNNQWINFTSDLRLALENEGYEVLVQNNDQPLQDLSDIDVLAIIDSLGTPFVSPNDRPLSLQDKTKILNFIASGKGFFFSGDWVFSELSKYNDIAGMFGATLSPNVIDYIPVYENGYVSPYFLPYDWNAYVFDFINFYQTYPSQPIFKRAPLYGYSSFSNADHAIFKNVNQVLLLGSSHIRPKGLQIEAGVKTHPTTSSPRDYPITPEGYPLIVAKNYGAGRVVLSCDSNCFANDGFAKSDLAGTDNKVFAMNVFNWLAKISALEGDLTILNPHNNDVFDFGQSINFIGSQTGNITNIEWVSSIDGVFAADTLSVTKSNLSPGTHTIILQGIIGGLPASIRSTARSQIRAAAIGDPVSASITITVEEPKPIIKIISLDFISGSGLDNRNRLYDRKETFKSAPIGQKFLEPTQWEGTMNSITGVVTESINWPVCYVRDGATYLSGPSKIRLSVKVDDFKAVSNPGSIEVMASGTIYGENGFQQTFEFSPTTFTPVSWPVLFEIESTTSLPNVVGSFNLEINWAFKLSGDLIGTQRTPKTGDFHKIYTTWEKPLCDGIYKVGVPTTGGYFYAEATPTEYLEIIDFSCQFLKGFGSTKTIDDVLATNIDKTYNYLGSIGYKYSVKETTTPLRRGIDRLLADPDKDGWCLEWSHLLKAINKAHGVNVKEVTGYLKPGITSAALIANGANYVAVGGVHSTDLLPPPGDVWWAFLNHRYVVNANDNSFDPTFGKADSNYMGYFEQMFDFLDLITTIPDPTSLNYVDFSFED